MRGPARRAGTADYGVRCVAAPDPSPRPTTGGHAAEGVDVRGPRKAPRPERSFARIGHRSASFSRASTGWRPAGRDYEGGSVAAPDPSPRPTTGGHAAKGVDARGPRRALCPEWGFARIGHGISSFSSAAKRFRLRPTGYAATGGAFGYTARVRLRHRARRISRREPRPVPGRRRTNSPLMRTIRSGGSPWRLARRPGRVPHQKPS